MALGRVTCQILLYSADPDFCQLIRIFHARHGKSLLARLPLAPWRPLVFALIPNGLCLLLLLSLVSLYGSNLQASVQRHLYEPVTQASYIDPTSDNQYTVNREGSLTVGQCGTHSGHGRRALGLNTVGQHYVMGG